MISLTEVTHPDDIPWVVRTLRERTSWGSWLTEEQIRGALKNSLCVWAHEFDGTDSNPVGFLRAVTDKHAFSSITDVWVEPHWRKRGVGSLLVERALSHPDIKPTICILGTRDAAGFYAKFGFGPVEVPVLQRDP